MPEQAAGNRRFVTARVQRGWHTQEEFVTAYDAMAAEMGEQARISVRQVRRWESGASTWPNHDARRASWTRSSVYPWKFSDLCARPLGPADAQNQRRRSWGRACVDGRSLGASW